LASHEGVEDSEAERRDAVECTLGYDPPCVVSLDTDGVEAGEDPVEHDDDTGGRFGSWDELDFAAVAVSFYGGAGADDKGREVYEPVCFSVLEPARPGVDLVEEAGGCGGELLPHLLFFAGVEEGAFGLDCGVDFGEPVEDEPFSHGTHDGVVPIDGGGDAADEPHLAFPGEGFAAVGADVACPGAVVDLAEGC
jgi:hypothetical protein